MSIAFFLASDKESTIQLKKVELALQQTGNTENEKEGLYKNEANRWIQRRYITGEGDWWNIEIGDV